MASNDNGGGRSNRPQHQHRRVSYDLSASSNFTADHLAQRLAELDLHHTPVETTVPKPLSLKRRPLPPLPQVIQPPPKMAAPVPKPGPAKLTPGAGLDEWLEQAKLCRYLPEPVMKQLCEMVKEVLMEGE